MPAFYLVVLCVLLLMYHCKCIDLALLSNWSGRSWRSNCDEKKTRGRGVGRWKKDTCGVVCLFGFLHLTLKFSSVYRVNLGTVVPVARLVDGGDAMKHARSKMRFSPFA